MILADKILNLRKNSGWSQEELAEKLHVTRQSISKWESAASIPDIAKIIDMSRLFGVSTDYLLKDDLDDVVYADGEPDSVRAVDLDETNAFLDDSRAHAKKIAVGVVLCILAPMLLISLPVLLGSYAGYTQGGAAAVPETLAVGIGMVVLLALAACAVALFIVSSSAVKRYQYIERGAFELSYGVAGVLREKWRAREAQHTAKIVVGVVLCILSPIPLILAGLAGANDLTCVLFLDLLLAVVAVAVYLFIVASSEKECYNKLLREEEYEESQVKTTKRVNKLGGIYWPVATAVYLAWSFISMRWDLTWLVWPVAGVLFGAICALLKMTDK